MGKINISKIEAAKRQITKAIKLWFQDEDPIAIHTLTCSAYQIVHDINTKQKGRDLLYDSLLIKDEYRKMWINKLKESYNFLKHADKDSQDNMEFDPSINEKYIMFTCYGLRLLNEEQNIAMAAFTLYQMLTHPEILTDEGRLDIEKYPESMREKVLEISKNDFYEYYYQYHSQLGRI